MMILQTRTSRLALLTLLSAISILYLGVTLGILTPPASSPIDIPWHRLPSSLGFGRSLRYVDGVAYVRNVGRKGRHPIEELLERGQKRAEALERRKTGVKSLGNAVRDYREAYGMEPPEGFDAWYKLAVSLDVPAVPSLYPLAHDSVLPFLSLPAPLLRRRARELLEKRGIFGLQYQPEADFDERTIAIKTDGITRFKTLPAEWVALSEDDTHLLPPNQQPQEPLMLPVWVDDVSHHPPSGRLLSRSRELALAGQVWDEEELVELEKEEETKKGWGNACEPVLNEQIGQDVLTSVEQANKEQASFIDNPMIYADPCIHPEHLRQNGELIMKEDWVVRGLLPMASLNSPIGGGEIIGPTSVERNFVIPYMPWSSKPESRLWWRGNPNSAFVYDKWDWRSSQRFRLSELATGKKERMAEKEVSFGVMASDKSSPVLLERGERLSREWRGKDMLRGTYFNVSLVDAKKGWPCGAHYSPFFYCDNPDGIRRPNCPPPMDECKALLDSEYDFMKMTGDKTYEYKHKFRLDVDGFGWTTRWREEMSKNNVVIKVTLYPEWWTPQAIPWYHYIPGRYDFSDLYDIMAFFTGAPEERDGEITPERQEVLRKRDKIAEGIAARGREFAVERLGTKDMRVYMFLLLLEYRRAWSDDRRAATFRMD